jgi:hypothetical protein
MLGVAAVAVSALQPIALSVHDAATTPPATANGGRALTPKELAEDLAVLRKAYETLHPGLCRYATRDEVAARFDELAATFSSERTLAETYLALSRFASTIRCGHTHTNFYNQPKEIVDALFVGRTRLPFRFRWIDGRMIVTGTFDATIPLAAGDEIATMGGVSVRELLAGLMPYARADGSNDAKRVRQFEVTGGDAWEAFDIFMPLVFPEIVRDAAGASRDRVALTVRGADGERLVDVPLMTHDEREHATAAAGTADPSRSKDAPAWTLDVAADAAVLRMPTWALYDSAWDWKGFVDRSIDELIEKRIPLLIVDIRGNEGGLDCGDAILARLVDREVTLDAYERWARYRTVPADLDPYLDTWDDSFRDLSKDALDASNGRTREGFVFVPREGGNANRTIAPRGERYTGKVVVLVDASNSSATFQFAQAVRKTGLGTLVGQPTGGNRRGINGGAFFFLRLPNSKIELDLPIYAFFLPNDGRPEEPDAGIVPDVVVMPTAEDVRNGVDAEMRAAKGEEKK